MPRQDKVCEAIKREVSTIIQNELNDPRLLGFITITRVEMTPDLRYAKVFYSVLGKDEDYQKTRKALDSAGGFIRKLIAERVPLRFAPDLLFREDRSGEYSVRIQEVLEEVKQLPGAQFESEKPIVKKIRKRAKVEPKKSSRVRKKK